MVAQLQSSPANTEDTGLIPGSGRSPGGGNCNSIQHPCLGNPVDRGAWWATGLGAKAWKTRPDSLLIIHEQPLEKSIMQTIHVHMQAPWRRKDLNLVTLSTTCSIFSSSFSIQFSEEKPAGSSSHSTFINPKTLQKCSLEKNKTLISDNILLRVMITVS